MKTAKFTSAIATLSIVLFMSIASIANSSFFYSGDLPKSGDKNSLLSNMSEKDFSYLRFDVTKYSNENEEADMVHNTLNYLRFDVNKYIISTESEAIDLPAANEFEYLRFDVNNYNDGSPANSSELPVNEFNYLRFDVNNYVSGSTDFIDELPVTV
jgi:hypothetical protein